jgi:hypothetical protein
MRGNGGFQLAAWMAWAVVLTAGGCGGATQSPDGASMSPDGASPGMCGADVPPGQACNTLSNVATAITPTCVSGTIPVGTGGTIADGTYVLTSQTYYQDTTCSKVPLSETIAIAGDCIQLVFGSIFTGTLSGTLTTQGNTFAATQTCQHFDVDGAVVSMDAQMKTYTATSAAFTLFSVNTTTGTSDVAVFTRR